MYHTLEIIDKDDKIQEMHYSTIKKKLSSSVLLFKNKFLEKFLFYKIMYKIKRKNK